MRYGYFYGMPGKRKMRSPLFDSPFMRRAYAMADRDCGWKRIREFDLLSDSEKRQRSDEQSGVSPYIVAW